MSWSSYPYYIYTLISLTVICLVISFIIAIRAIVLANKKYLADKTIKHLYLFLFGGFILFTASIGIHIVGYKITMGFFSLRIIHDKVFITWMVYLIYIHLLKFVPPNTRFFPISVLIAISLLITYWIAI
jgi:hypothetical protein